ncbi:hypothetical protein [Nocardia sp. NPDC003183]
METNLNPPTLTAEEGGLVLGVAQIAIHNPLALPGETTYSYLVAEDGVRYRIPAPLHDWATTTLAEHGARFGTGLPPILPGRFEFGIRDGQMFANAQGAAQRLAQ